jgi:hypothetical protein
MRLATSPGEEPKKTNKVKPDRNLEMTGDELLGYYYDRLYETLLHMKMHPSKTKRRVIL